MKKNTQPKILIYTKDECCYTALENIFSNCKNDETDENYYLYPQFNIYKDDIYGIRDLRLLLLNINIEDLSSLTVIIDRKGLRNKNNKKVKDEPAKTIRELIVEYPEVKFVFYEKTRDDFEDFIYLINGIYTDSIQPQSMHVLCQEDLINSTTRLDTIRLLINGNNNLFDASNIRNTIKQKFLKEELKVQLNYGKNIDSRQNNLALCVEEEQSQCLFNSYALYASGYRVRCIHSATELSEVNLNVLQYKVMPKIIIRDYDLQFEDKPIENGKNQDSIIYKIRGYNRNSKQRTIGTNGITNNYWDNLKNITTLFITQASNNEGIIFNEVNRKCKEYIGNDRGGFVADNEVQPPYIYGLQKPVNGIYDFHNIAEIHLIDDACSYDAESDAMTIKRIDDQSSASSGHSSAPFIYHIAESLISRAKSYYELDNYLLAAVLSREALEVLNGFHKSLMWEAIHLHAVSENALIMSQIGCEDTKLAANLELRLSSIKKEVQRISGDNSNANKNVLLQIYSDIRAFCREREHFTCADVALKRMVHEQHKIKTFDYSVYGNDKQVSTCKVISNIMKSLFYKCKAEYKIILSIVLFFVALYFCRTKPECDAITIEWSIIKYFFITVCIGAIFFIINLLRQRYKDEIKEFISKYKNESLYHFKHFAWPIICLLVLLISVCIISVFCDDGQNEIILYIFSVLSYLSMATIIILFLCRPMYVVYSLVTTRGSLMKFIAMLTVVMGLFSGIYYCGFFHNAGIAYNIDAPQIVYGLFDQNTKNQLNCYRTTYNTSDEDYYKHDDLLELDNTICDTLLLKIEGHGHNKLGDGEKRIYKKVTPLFVISNTVETTLEQGATDFFNHVMADYKKCNRPKKQLFRAIVLFHILISWIFLGVFISMLYQKFRNE